VYREEAAEKERKKKIVLRRHERRPDKQIKRQEILQHWKKNASTVLRGKVRQGGAAGKEGACGIEKSCQSSLRPIKREGVKGTKKQKGLFYSKHTTKESGNLGN